MVSFGLLYHFNDGVQLSCDVYKGTNLILYYCSVFVLSKCLGWMHWVKYSRNSTQRLLHMQYVHHADRSIVKSMDYFNQAVSKVINNTRTKCTNISAEPFLFKFLQRDVSVRQLGASHSSTEESKMLLCKQLWQCLQSHGALTCVSAPICGS